jgi:hypothetical protein
MYLFYYSIPFKELRARLPRCHKEFHCAESALRETAESRFSGLNETAEVKLFRHSFVKKISFLRKNFVFEVFIETAEIDSAVSFNSGS